VGVDLVANPGHRGGNRRTMHVMRVDNPEHNHDHGFGLGSGQTDPQETAAGEHTSSHGLFEHLGGDAAGLVHTDPGHLEHDFGQHHDTGFDGLHDSVHSIG